MTDDEIAEALRQAVENYRVLRDVTESVRAKAELFAESDEYGLALAAHMVAESIQVYTVAFKRAYERRLL